MVLDGCGLSVYPLLVLVGLNFLSVRFFSIFLTFQFIVMTFMVFRAKDITSAWLMLKKMFTVFDPGLAWDWVHAYLTPFAILLLGILLHFTPMSWTTGLQKAFVRVHWSLKAVIVALAVLIIYQSYNTEAQPFIYLDF